MNKFITILVVIKMRVFGYRCLDCEQWRWVHHRCPATAHMNAAEHCAFVTDRIREAIADKPADADVHGAWSALDELDRVFKVQR